MTPSCLVINDECISCGACEDECPVGAIEEGEEQYHITVEYCNNCEGHYLEPACIQICPVEAILPCTISED